MLRIVDDLNYQECCNGIMCENCSLREMHYDGFWSCKIEDWIRKQPRFDDKERLIPIAKVTFDEGKLEEICNKAISDLIIKCPNCGTEIKPKKEGEAGGSCGYCQDSDFCPDCGAYMRQKEGETE